MSAWMSTHSASWFRLSACVSKLRAWQSRLSIWVFTVSQFICLLSYSGFWMNRYFECLCGCFNQWRIQGRGEQNLHQHSQRQFICMNDVLD